MARRRGSPSLSSACYTAGGEHVKSAPAPGSVCLEGEKGGAMLPVDSVHVDRLGKGDVSPPPPDTAEMG
jgi:hypothetical protein